MSSRPPLPRLTTHESTNTSPAPQQDATNTRSSWTGQGLFFFLPVLTQRVNDRAALRHSAPFFSTAFTSPVKQKYWDPSGANRKGSFLQQPGLRPGRPGRPCCPAPRSPALNRDQPGGAERRRPTLKAGGGLLQAAGRFNEHAGV